jgi:hypothetical protein
MQPRSQAQSCCRPSNAKRHASHECQRCRSRLVHGHGRRSRLLAPFYLLLLRYPISSRRLVLVALRDMSASLCDTRTDPSFREVFVLLLCSLIVSSNSFFVFLFYFSSGGTSFFFKNGIGSGSGSCYCSLLEWSGVTTLSGGEIFPHFGRMFAMDGYEKHDRGVCVCSYFVCN